MLEFKKNVLTIAGSDPSGGAGIQTDLRVFNSLELHGSAVITCLTAQNTQGVKKIEAASPEIVEEQIDFLLKDLDISSTKTGMLYTSEIAKIVAKKIKKYNLKTVIDPVMIATSGESLAKKSFVDLLKKELLTKAYILTPNIDEAEALTGNKISCLEDMKKTCIKLYDMGSKHIFLKGGHLKNAEESIDVFFDGKDFSIFSLPRLNIETHGSGCNLSSLITGYLALGKAPIDAVGKSKYVLWNMIKKSYKPGKGFNILDVNQKVINEIPEVFVSSNDFKVWFELNECADTLIGLLSTDMIPEVGINIGYALSNAKTIDHVVGLDGRIIKRKGKACKCGKFCFGGSKHVASIILTVMNYNFNYRCAMNLKYSKKNLDKCKKAGFAIIGFDRKDEPDNIDSTMEWGTKKVLDELKYVPDVIYDTGDVGKEPMIRLLAKNPTCLVDKVKLIC